MNKRFLMYAAGAFVLVFLFLTLPISLKPLPSNENPMQAPDGPDLFDSRNAAAAAQYKIPAYLSGPWVYTGGPTGGLGYDVRMDPSNPDVMYVTDGYAGAFKSVDGGATWFPINNGITTRLGEAIPVFSLSIDPNNPATLWLGTQYSSDVYRSDDAGENWTLKKNGISENQLSVRGFTVQPGNSNVVYMGAEVSSWEWNGDPLPGLGLDMTKGVVYKTVDGGENWSKLWEGDNLARYIWINPQNIDELFVSTGIFDREAANSNSNTLVPGGVGMLHSTDGGVNWQVLDEANGLNPLELYFGSLYMKPNSPNVLLTAAGNDPYTPFIGQSLGGIYRTEDSGNSWTEVLGPYNFSAVEFCETAPSVAYAGALSGFYRSEDAGENWVQTGGSAWGPPGIVAGFPIDIQCDPRDPLRLFVNNYGGGNFLSEDGGITWTNSSKGYTGALVRGLAIFPDYPAHVYVSARSGLFFSSTGGQSWNGISNGLAQLLDAIVIAVDPENSLHVLASIADVGPNPLESWDGGQTWSVVATGIIFPQANTITGLWYAPSDGQVVYAAISHLDCLVSGSCDVFPGYGLIVSHDGGTTWEQHTPLDSGHVLGLAIAHQDSAVAFAAVVDGGLYRTEDAGLTWQLVNPTPGQTLPKAGNVTPQLATLALDPQNPNRLMMGFRAGGVAISEDAGVSWVNSSAGMPAESDVLDIEIDPFDPAVVYAGTFNAGVFLSLDGGAVWTELNDGLSNKAVRRLALSRDGSVLYMGSEGAGIYRLGTLPPNIYLPVVLR